MFSWLRIAGPDDYDALIRELTLADFGLPDVVSWLKEYLSDAVGGVLIEYPYVDKDYRSTFYHYYAKKGGVYSPHSARLHFFDSGVEWKQSPQSLVVNGSHDLSTDEALNSHYFGFVVLRPTRINTIGRTMLSPKAVKGASGLLIEHRHKAHVLGYRLHVSCFPFMQQHTDIAVCAHAACWAILRHYSERYSLYREVLVHDISKLGREFDPGGLLPSLGITYRDAERIFAAVGNYPLLVVKGDIEDDMCRFHDELLAYLESGFPLFGVQSTRGHAVAIVGYRRNDLVAQTTGDNFQGRAWDFVTDLAVVDDNLAPYHPVSRNCVNGADYCIDDFDAFIVPLPEKMFLPAAAAFRWANEARDDAMFEHFEHLTETKELVTRCFVTTTASWQRFVREQSGSLPPDFVDIALSLTMPQFVWVVEYATPAQRSAKRVQARLLLDATAGTRDPFPMFLLHDSNGALWLDRANRAPMHYQAFMSTVSFIAEMESNLKRY
jgi:hypothetical protein